MENIYADIAKRSEGTIMIGVVGPVRTGKSTFIKRFMDLLVIPNIQNVYSRDRARDELPQSGAGRTIMTTRPMVECSLITLLVPISAALAKGISSSDQGVLTMRGISSSK